MRRGREILALIIEGLTVNQPKCKTRDASRASGGVKSDGTRHGGTGMVTKADGEEIVDKEESGPNRAAATAGLKSSVIGTTRDMAEGSNKLGGTEKKRVFHKQTGQKVETTGFEVGSSVDGRGRGHKQIDGIRGTAKG